VQHAQRKTNVLQQFSMRRLQTENIHYVT
jgi:hypothetical protein